MCFWQGNNGVIQASTEKAHVILRGSRTGDSGGFKKKQSKVKVRRLVVSQPAYGKIEFTPLLHRHDMFGYGRSWWWLNCWGSYQSHRLMVWPRHMQIECCQLGIELTKIRVYNVSVAHVAESAVWFNADAQIEEALLSLSPQLLNEVKINYVLTDKFH